MPTTLCPTLASKFAGLALAHVTREYPNKMDHVLNGPTDVVGPRAAHPIFYGSFDWHSCVHGYWLLTRLYREFPPRLGFFPDLRLNCLELLLARLPEAALIGPTLAPFGAPLFGGRPFHVGVTCFRKSFLWRCGSFAGLFGRFCRWRWRRSGLGRR